LGYSWAGLSWGVRVRLASSWETLLTGMQTVELHDLKALKKKVENCLEAAKLATGCELKYEWAYVSSRFAL
jgi:hypothetical protein